MTKFFLLLLIPSFVLAQEYEYSKKVKDINSLFQSQEYKKANEKVGALIPLSIKLYGKLDERTAQLYFIAGFTNVRLSNVDIAIDYLEKFVEISHQIKTNNSQAYIASIFILGELLARRGDNKNAENFFDLGVKELKVVVSPENTTYYSYLGKAGAFYNSLNQFKKAEKILIETINFAKKRFGKDIDYVVGSKNLALIYLKDNRKEEGIKLLSEIIPIAKKIQFKYPLNKSLAFNESLADIYFYSSEYQDALMIYEQLYSYYKSRKSFNYYKLSSTLNNLAESCRKLGNHKRAIDYLTKSLTLERRNHGLNSINYAIVAENLALSYWQIDQTQLALEYLIQVQNSIRGAMNEKMSFLSDAEKLIFNLKFETSFDVFASYVSKFSNDDNKLTQELYNNILFRKNLLLDASRNTKKTIRQQNNENLKKYYTELISTNESIVKLYDKNEYLETVEIGRLKQNTNTLEKKIARTLDSLNININDKIIDWKQIQSLLSDDEVAIEIINFKDFDGDNWKSDIIYAALILTPNKEFPKLKILGKERDLSALQMNQKSANSINNLLKDWNPLSSLFETILQDQPNTKQIFISSSGILNTIPISSLFHLNSSSRNNVNIVRLTSTSRLKEYSSKVELKSAALYGGIKYNNDWPYLPGTKTEIEKISSFLLSTDSCDVSLYTSKEATKDSFKSYTKSSIIHLATHGFFSGDKTSLVTFEKKVFDNPLQRESSKNFKNSIDPLMNSGLIFAPNESQNSILTAMEASILDLSNVDLLVLSACETGLGQTINLEGVYGLQRAFKVAGVQQLLVSLWKIPDQETQLFMSIFYQELIQSKDAQLAFTKTQKIMSESFEPYFWAGFMLIQ